MFLVTVCLGQLLDYCNSLNESPFSNKAIPLGRHPPLGHEIKQVPLLNKPSPPTLLSQIVEIQGKPVSIATVEESIQVLC